MGASGGAVSSFWLLVLRLHCRLLFPPQVSRVSRPKVIMERPAAEAPMHSVRSDATEGGPLSRDIPLEAEVDQAEAVIPNLPLAPRHEEVGSSSVAALAHATPLVGGPHALDDGPKADVWLEMMKRRGAFDELVVFFYDSFTEMTGHVGEFFGLQQGIYASYGVRN